MISADSSRLEANISLDQSDLDDPLLAEVRDYWDGHIHDVEVTTQPVGSLEFFEELDAYRFDKLRYLPQIVKFDGYRGKNLLEVGCGVGIDLARFARGGAVVTGIDLSPAAVDLAKQNFTQRGLSAQLMVMNGEQTQFDDQSFDIVYAHGVLQYTPHASQMISEIWRVLRPTGIAILMVYNRYSWLNWMSKVLNVGLEHEDAPVLTKYSRKEFERMLEPFKEYSITAERFPVATRLHHGWKAKLYNQVFVNLFNLLPKKLVRPLGWHLIAFARK